MWKLRALWVVGVAGLSLACLGGSRDGGDTGDQAPDTSLFLRDCDVRCDQDGLDLAIDAVGATSASVEFFARGERAATFPLNRLDDETWVAYPEWPSGYSFDDCGGEADFVCVIVGEGGEEIREAR